MLFPQWEYRINMKFKLIFFFLLFCVTFLYICHSILNNNEKKECRRLCMCAVHFLFLVSWSNMELNVCKKFFFIINIHYEHQANIIPSLLWITIWINFSFFFVFDVSKTLSTQQYILSVYVVCYSSANRIFSVNNEIEYFLRLTLTQKLMSNEKWKSLNIHEFDLLHSTVLHTTSSSFLQFRNF